MPPLPGMGGANPGFPGGAPINPGVPGGANPALPGNPPALPPVGAPGGNPGAPVSSPPFNPGAPALPPAGGANPVDVGAALRKQVNYKIDEGVTFAEALNKLSQATGVTFVIRQDQFAANGVDDIQKMKMKPLTVNGQGLVVLDVLARQIKASYKVEKGVVVIAPKE